jgi:hypothetical protein
MKKTLITLAVLFFGTALYSFSQDRKWAIKLNPLSLAIKTGNVQFERVIGKTTSLQLGLSYTPYLGYTITDVAPSQFVSAFQITPEFRKYFGRASSAMRGFYVGPYFRLRTGHYTIDDTNVTKTFTSFAIGSVLGYEKISKKDFVFDAFIGPNAGFASGEHSSDVSRSVGNILSVRFGIALGFGK